MNPDDPRWIKRVKETASFSEMAVVLREWLATIEAMKIEHFPKPKD